MACINKKNKKYFKQKKALMEEYKKEEFTNRGIEEQRIKEKSSRGVEEFPHHNGQANTFPFYNLHICSWKGLHLVGPFRSIKL